MVTKYYDGTGIPAAEPIILHVGQLTASYEAGMLRYIRLGEIELLRGIYAAVRDQNWSTIPGSLQNVQIDSESDHFQITFISVHQQGDIHFEWRGEILGTSDNQIRFSFDGQALSDFNRNRIGFCILHPATTAGKPLQIEHVDGDVEQGAFPISITPHQPFIDIRAITHEPIEGIRVQTLMEGDTFEMEDQRNWSDASYKTYCTPLGQPKPILVTSGTGVQQTITLSVTGNLPPVADTPPLLRLQLDASKGIQLPAIGLCVAGDEPLTPLQIERLRALHLHHLRADLQVDSSLEMRLKQALTQAEAVGAQLELAVHFSDNLDAEVARLRHQLETLEFSGQLLLFRQGEKSTTVEVIQKVRQAFEGYPYALVFAGGTNIYFTELNRFRPPTELLDAVAFSVNPQVHAFDNASLVETLPTLSTILDSVREFAPNKPIQVTPVTLKMRFNPEAIASQLPDPNQLPPQVDLRQMSLFGAGWTLGSLSYLGTAKQLTYFQTVGSQGVMEREAGTLLPDQFPSTPNSVYPMYHVFADVGEFAGGEIIQLVSSDPLKVNGLALRRDGKLRVMLTNHTVKQIQVNLSRMHGDFHLKSLDETTVENATNRPEIYRQLQGQQVTSRGDLAVDLLPYAVLTLDQIM